MRLQAAAAQRKQATVFPRASRKSWRVAASGVGYGGGDAAHVDAGHPATSAKGHEQTFKPASQEAEPTYEYLSYAIRCV